MSLQRVLNSQQGGEWALRVSRVLPVGFGLRLSRTIGGYISKKKDLPLVQAIRLNRWVVSGCELDAASLDREVRENLRAMAGAFFLLFHYLNQPEQLQKQVIFSQNLDELIIRSSEERHKLVVCGIHMSNFDLVLQAAAWRGLQALAISLPEVTENTEAVAWQNQFRRQTGLKILPASLSTFRQAIRHLQAGGTVVTGIDRPIAQPKYRPLFFNQPCSLPVHHIYLALEADTPLILLAATQNPDGKYQIHSSDEIRLRRFSDREKETTWNASMVLEIAADFIRLKPEQWSITLPVWPEMIGSVP